MARRLCTVCKSKPIEDAVVPYCIPNDHSSKKGVNCLLREEAPDAFNLLSIVRRELYRRAVDAKCNGQLYQRTHMTEDEIVKFCLTNFHTKEDQVKRDLTNLEILIFNNPKWGLNILNLDEDRDTVTENDVARDMEQVIFNRDVKNIVALIQLKPDLPLSCTFYNGVKVTVTAFLLVIALTVALYGTTWIYKRYRQYELRQRLELTQMVERILELLQQASASDDAREDGENGFVVINHVRDMILPVTDRKSKEKLWQKAMQFINENESRVRTEVQEVKGEPFEVWRWIGSSNLSNSGGKFRPGRRIVDVQYLIDETLKFPHKKLRFCKNTDVEIKSELREGFQSILLLQCKNCSKEHAVCTENPDMDIMNVNLAFVSGIISLGMSLYHLNELCNSLQIPTVSGKEYNLYLDEIFEIYKDSTKDSESNVSEKSFWSSTPNKEDSILTAILPNFEDSAINSTGRVLRSSVSKSSQSKKEEFLKQLAKTPEQIKQLAKETMNQKDSPIWMEERRMRLTASNFGRICKLQTSTNKDKVAEDLLNPKFTGNECTRYGNENEVKAIRDFEKIFGQAVKACGMYVHPVHPYLAASPDGLLSDNALVEIKCPFKAQKHTPEEAVQKKLIAFATFEHGEFRLKRNDNYYYQIQGQLQVTGREECYFVVWTPKGLLYDRVVKDDDFWNEVMLPKLREFYMEYMLPKLSESP